MSPTQLYIDQLENIRSALRNFELNGSDAAAAGLGYSCNWDHRRVVSAEEREAVCDSLVDSCIQACKVRIARGRKEQD